jgi:hypothetical protein
MNYFSFDGSSSALDCGSALTVTGDCTIAVRLKPDTYTVTSDNAVPFGSDNYSASPRSEFQVVFHTAVNTNFNFECGVLGSDGYLGDIATIASVFPSGIDAYVAIVRTGAVWVLWVNGVSIASVTTTTGTMAFFNLRIGCIFQVGANTAWCKIKAAQFGIWRGAWNSTDLANHAAGNDPTSIEWGNIAQYQPLQVNHNDIFGATIADIGSPGFSGTAQTLSASPAAVAWGSTGTITFTGTGTFWATGTAPMMASAGTPSSDTIGSTTSRSISFVCPSSGAAVTFTDPSTGQTATVALGPKARHFDATTDSIVLTPSTSLSGAQGVAFHIAFKLDAGSTTLGSSFGTLLSKAGPAGQVFWLVYSNAANPLGFFSPASNFIGWRASDGTHYQTWQTSYDPFAGMAGDGLWHYAAQITEIEALRLQTTFANAIRGLLLHDIFVFAEASKRLVSLKCTP